MPHFSTLYYYLLKSLDSLYQDGAGHWVGSLKPMTGSDSDHTCIFIISMISVTWGKAQFLFCFATNIVAGKAKQKWW